MIQCIVCPRNHAVNLLFPLVTSSITVTMVRPTIYIKSVILTEFTGLKLDGQDQGQAPKSY